MPQAQKLIDAIKEYKKSKDFLDDRIEECKKGTVSSDECARIRQLTQDKWDDVEEALRGF